MMRAKQIYAFIARDVKMILSDKVALFWLVAWPLIWILMVAYIFVPPGAVSPVKLTVGIVNHDVNVTGLNFTSKDFIEVLSNVTYEGEKIFDVKVYSNESLLVDELRQGKLDVGIVIPENFSINLTTGTAKVRVLISAKDAYSASLSYSVISVFLNEFSRRVSLIKANIATIYFEKSLEYAGQYTPLNMSLLELAEYVRRYVYGIAIPLDVVYEEVKPEVYASRANVLGWYTIGAVGMIFLYGGFSQGASAIYRERVYGTLRRVLASPTTPSTLITALMLSNITILLISSLILLLTGVYGIGARILFNPVNPTHWLLPVLLLTAAYMSLGIGLVLSLFAKTEHGAYSLGIALGMLLAFTAGIWFPRSWMPQWLQVLAEYFPITWVIDTVRNIMVYDAGLNQIWVDLVKISVALVAVISIDIVAYKVKIRKIITSY